MATAPPERSEEAFDTSWQLLFEPPSAPSELRPSCRLSSTAAPAGAETLGRHQDVWRLKKGDVRAAGDDEETCAGLSASLSEGYSSGSESEARRPRAPAEAASDGGLLQLAPSQPVPLRPRAIANSSRPPQPPMSPQEATAPPGAPLSSTWRRASRPPPVTTWRRQPPPPSMSPHEAEAEPEPRTDPPALAPARGEAVMARPSAEQAQAFRTWPGGTEKVEEFIPWASDDTTQEMAKEMPDCRWRFAELAKEATGVSQAASSGGASGPGGANDVGAVGTKIDLKALFGGAAASSGDRAVADGQDNVAYRSPFCSWTSPFAAPRQANAGGAGSMPHRPCYTGPSLF